MMKTLSKWKMTTLIMSVLLTVTLTGCTTVSRTPPIELPLLNIPDDLLSNPKGLVKTKVNNKDYTTSEDIIAIMQTVNTNYNIANKNKKQLESLILIIEEYNNQVAQYNDKIKAR